VTLGGMSWRQTLYVHWIVPAARLRERLPRGVTLDQWRGHALVSLVAFDVEGPAPRRLLHTSMAPLFHYQQLNLRTYVDGPEGPGMTLLHTRLDRVTWALGARLVGMPYHLDRKLAYAVTDDTVQLRARDLVLDGKIAPGASHAMPSGSLEQFADDRFRLYAPLPGARTLCVKITHEPWRARPLRLHELRMPDDFDLPLDLPPAAAQVCEDVEVVVEHAATFAAIDDRGLAAHLAPA
jgi:uncharacterized protein YqjF (DUF2071 family)